MFGALVPRVWRRSDAPSASRPGCPPPCWWSARPSRLWWRLRLCFTSASPLASLGPPLGAAYCELCLRSSNYLAVCKVLATRAKNSAQAARLIHRPRKRWDVIHRCLSTHIANPQIFGRRRTLQPNLPPLLRKSYSLGHRDGVAADVPCRVQIT